MLTSARGLSTGLTASPTSPAAATPSLDEAHTHMTNHSCGYNAETRTSRHRTLTAPTTTRTTPHTN
eukprot:144799-Alexandrium_andersonii.AAC.1